MKLKKMRSLCIVFVMFSCLISCKLTDSNPLSILKLAYNLDRGREDDSAYSMMYKNELNIAKPTNSMSINMSLTIGANAISTEKQQKASGKIQVIIGSSFKIEDIICCLLCPVDRRFFIDKRACVLYHTHIIFLCYFSKVSNLYEKMVN